MLNTLSLLSMKHPAAMKSMIQEKLVLGVSVGHLMTANPIALQNGAMRVGVYLTPQAYKDPTWLYRGESEFTYNRMDLENFFQGINLVVAIPAVARTRHLVNKLERIFDIDIDDLDYIDEEILHGGQQIFYTLRASPTSQRWRGRVGVIVGPPAPPLPIPDVILDGVNPGSLSDISLTTLDGFVVP